MRDTSLTQTATRKTLRLPERKEAPMFLAALAVGLVAATPEETFLRESLRPLDDGRKRPAIALKERLLSLLSTSQRSTCVRTSSYSWCDQNEASAFASFLELGTAKDLMGFDGEEFADGGTAPSSGCVTAAGPMLLGVQYTAASDQPPVDPDWFPLALSLVVDRGCQDYLTTETCEPNVVRNDTVSNAAFYQYENIIRYNWAYLTTAGKAMCPSTRDLILMVVGILAHEYGHFLSNASHGFLKLEFLALDQRFAGLSPEHQEELWADSVAGCTLASTRIAVRPFEQFLQGVSLTAQQSHPAPELRLRAVELGWGLCSRTAPPPSRLIRDREGALVGCGSRDARPPKTHSA